MNTKEILRHIDKYWDIAIKSLNETSPKDKTLIITSGKVQERLNVLYNRHRENLKDLFETLTRFDIKENNK